MAIGKKPASRNTQVSTERKAEAFIEAVNNREGKEETGKVPISLKFDRELLKRVDAAAKRRGINRTAWLQFVASRALDNGEG